MWKTVAIATSGIAILSFVFYAVNNPDKFTILQSSITPLDIQNAHFVGCYE